MLKLNFSELIYLFVISLSSISGGRNDVKCSCMPIPYFTDNMNRKFREFFPLLCQNSVEIEEYGKRPTLFTLPYIP